MADRKKLLKDMQELKDTVRPRQETKEKMISVDMLHPSPRNPFAVENDEAMIELIASIKREGIIVPLIVRPLEEGEYEIISGHRRHYAAKEEDIPKVPCIIKDVTEEEADIIMVDTNLNRPHIRISEKAFAYKLKYEAIKKTKYKHRNEYSPELEKKHNSSLEVAREMGVCEANIRKYIRLTKLYKPLLDLVDKRKITIRQGFELSFLPITVQQYVFEGITVKGVKMYEDMAKTLRKQFENRGNVTRNDFYEEMLHQNKNRERPRIRIDASIKNNYFNGYTNDEIEKVIRELLTRWIRRRLSFEGERK